ncbi:MAG: bile acid:sodium symporter, partial [Planctomycetes bacterium]|nr:bile acid:sodium symporter [Planctomycetota bacterium]
LGACVCLHVFLLGWSYGGATLLGLEPATRTAVVYCGSQKTLPNGIYLWTTFFSSNPYGAVPLVLYHLSQLIIDTLILPIFERQNARSTSPPGTPPG